MKKGPLDQPRGGEFGHFQVASTGYDMPVPVPFTVVWLIIRDYGRHFGRPRGITIVTPDTDIMQHVIHTSMYLCVIIQIFTVHITCQYGGRSSCAGSGAGQLWEHWRFWSARLWGQLSSFFVYCGFILYLFFIASFQKKKNKKKKEKFLQQVPVSVRINSFNCKRPTSQLQSLYIKPSPFDHYLNRESTLSPPRLIEF